MSPSYTADVLLGDGAVGRRTSGPGAARACHARAPAPTHPEGPHRRGPGPRAASSSAALRWRVGERGHASDAAARPAAPGGAAPRVRRGQRATAAAPSPASRACGRAARRPARRARRRPRAAARAVRASASATPPASTSSSSGSTSCRSRTRVNRGSALCGSSQTGSSRRRAGGPGDGAAHPEQRAQPRRVPGRASRRASAARTRGPARAAPSRPGRRGCARAAPASPGAGGRRAARRSGRAGPRPRSRPAPSTSTGCTAGDAPSPASSSTVAAARSAEPSCRPWSTTAACTGPRPRDRERRGGERERVGATGAGRPAAVRAAARAGSAASAARTARRTSATAARSRAVGHRASGLHDPCGDQGVDAPQPAPGVGQLGAGRQGLRALPHPVEPVHPGGQHHVRGERGAHGVLAHLGLHPEQRAQEPVDQPAAAPARGEPVPDGGDAGHHVRPDGVHHVVGVALQQRGQREQPVEHGPLLGALQQLDDRQRVAAGRADRPQHLGQRSQDRAPRSGPAPWAIDRNRPTSSAK